MIVNSTAIGQVQPPPGVSNPCIVPTRTPITQPGVGAYGPDHTFCSTDDPQSARGIPQTLPAVTGGAIGAVINVNPGMLSAYTVTPGQNTPTPAPTKNVGPFAVLGGPFTCDTLLTPGIPPMTPTPGFTPTAGPYATGAGLAGAFGALNQPVVSTIVVTNVQFSR